VIYNNDASQASFTDIPVPLSLINVTESDE
ncbi:unnamed protein product, partial [Rotaria magnacalcarata]